MYIFAKSRLMLLFLAKKIVNKLTVQPIHCAARLGSLVYDNCAWCRRFGINKYRNVRLDGRCSCTTLSPDVVQSHWHHTQSHTTTTTVSVWVGTVCEGGLCMRVYAGIYIYCVDWPDRTTWPGPSPRLADPAWPRLTYADPAWPVPSRAVCSPAIVMQRLALFA